MQKKSQSFNYSIFKDLEDLPPQLKSLFERAFEARKVAYAPYSNFKVGAAILLENGAHVIGNNQENASYPVGVCAERVALNSAASQFPDQKIEKIAIVAGKNMENDHPTAPCGICRQSLLEYESKQNSPIEVYFMGTQGPIIGFQKASDLLPFGFDGSLLI